MDNSVTVSYNEFNKTTFLIGEIPVNLMMNEVEILINEEV